MKTIGLFLLCILNTLFADPVHLETAALFAGTSTLHDFTGTGKALPAAADWTPTEQGGVLNAESIVFEVSTLSTDHAKRDKNMMKMFEPDLYPRLTGSIRNWKLGGVHNRKPHLLRLKIHGTPLEVPVKIDSLDPDETGLRLRCTFTLSLKACGLKRPSVLGLIRVGDEVTVTVNTLILPGPLPPQ